MPDLHSDLYLFNADNGFELAGGATGAHAGAWKDTDGVVHLFGRVQLPVGSAALAGSQPFLKLPEGWHPADKNGQPERDAAARSLAGQGIGGGGLVPAYVYPQGAFNAGDEAGIGVWYWGDPSALHGLEITLDGFTYVAA